MGNRVCFKPGKKFGNMLNVSLSKPFDPALSVQNRNVKEFLEYLENDFSKMPHIPSYLQDRITRRRGQLTPESLNLLLNSYQFFNFVLQSAVKLNNARLEVLQPNAELMKIKMGVQKFDFLEKLHLKKSKKRKIDSQFLLHFLPFQERAFKITESLLAHDFPFTDAARYSANQRELLYLVIEYFARTFRVWSVFGLKNFSTQVQEIFQTLMQKARVFVEEARCLRELGNAFEHMPMRMYKPTHYDILILLQTAFYASEKTHPAEYQELVQKLLRNLLKKRKQRFVFDILNYYSKPERRMTALFISAASDYPELETTVLDFLVEKLAVEDDFLPILVSLLRKCSVEMLNTTNFNKLTDYLFTMLPKDSIRGEDKREFFRILFLKSQKNFYIGRYNFFKNVFVKLKARLALTSNFIAIFRGLPLDNDGLLPHDVLDKIVVKLAFEILASRKEFIDVFVMILEGDQARLSEQGLRDLVPDILRKLQAELEISTVNSLQSPRDLLVFAKLMRTFIYIQLFLGKDSYTRREYAYAFTELLAQVNSLDAFLFYVLCLYQFEKRFEENEQIIEIIRKYDPLLERPGYRAAFKLMEVGSFDQEPPTSLVGAVRNENASASNYRFRGDVAGIIKILQGEFKLMGFKSQGVFGQSSPVFDHDAPAAGPDHSSFLGSQSRGYLEMNDESAAHDDQDFQDIFRRSMQKHLLKQDFREKISRNSEIRGTGFSSLSSQS